MLSSSTGFLKFYVYTESQNLPQKTSVFILKAMIWPFYLVKALDMDVLEKNFSILSNSILQISSGQVARLNMFVFCAPAISFINLGRTFTIFSN